MHKSFFLFGSNYRLRNLVLMLQYIRIQGVEQCCLIRFMTSMWSCVLFDAVVREQVEIRRRRFHAKNGMVFGVGVSFVVS